MVAVLDPAVLMLDQVHDWSESGVEGRGAAVGLRLRVGG